MFGLAALFKKANVEKSAGFEKCMTCSCILELAFLVTAACNIRLSECCDIFCNELIPRSDSP